MLSSNEAGDRKRQHSLESEVVHAQYGLSPDGILALSDQGEILSFNERLLELWGLPRELVAGGDAATVLNQIRTALVRPNTLRSPDAAEASTGTADSVPLQLRDGRTIEWRHTPVELGGAAIQGHIHFFRDITEHYRAEQMARESEELFRQLAENVDAVFWLHDRASGRMIYVSPAFDHIWGFPRQELLNDPDRWWEAVHPDDRLHARQALEPLPETEVQFEFRIICPDGDVRWIRNRAFPVRDGDGRIFRIAGTAEDVTEQRISAAALRLAHAQLGHVLSTSPTILYTLRIEPAGPLRPVWVSDNVEAILGYSPDEVLRPGWWHDNLHPADRETPAEKVQQLFERGSVAHEYRFRHRDGSFRWMHDELRVVDTGTGDSREVVGSWTDVSEQKRSDTMIRESERSYRSLFDSLTELVFIIGTDGQLLTVNDAVLRRSGLSREEFVGSGLIAALDQERVDPDGLRLLVERAADGEPQRAEVWGRTRSDPSFPLDLTLTRGHYFGAEVVVAVGRDVTDAHRARELLAAAEAHYRRLVDASPHGIFAMDVDGRFIEVNPAALAVTGHQPGELLGRSFSVIIDPDDFERARDAFRAWLRGEAGSEDVELHMVHASGERRLLQLRGAPILEGGRPVGVHGVARDITEERSRDERARLLAAALEGLEEGVAIFTPEGDMVYHNAAHGRILDHPSLEERPLNIVAFIAEGPARREFEEIVASVLTTGSWSGRVQRRRLGDGRLVPVQVIVGRMDRGDEPPLLISIVRDITEELQSERRLRRAERLASVGTLIGGVAHELNNPLHAIRNFAELMLDTPRDPEEREDLETIRREADRAAQIVADLRLLAWRSQVDDSKKAPVDLNDVVEHVLKIRGYSLTTANVEVRRDLADGLPRIHGDRGQLEQVLLNLVVNAEQAMAGMEGSKRLIVRTRASDRGASLFVIDNGPGVAPEHMDRLFDPFWTTKAPGEGTGLGLPLVHGIVTEHGGEIHLDSEPGKGACFRVDLPASEEAPPEPRAQRSADVADRRLRILVVEDEPALRRSLQRYLARRGHTVDCAADGMEALDLLAGPAEYDVILSDLRMPGMSGESFVARLRDDPRELHNRLILMTGDAASPQAVHVLRGAGVPVLVKPVPLRAVTEAIEERAAAAEAAG